MTHQSLISKMLPIFVAAFIRSVKAPPCTVPWTHRNTGQSTLFSSPDAAQPTGSPMRNAAWVPARPTNTAAGATGMRCAELARPSHRLQPGNADFGAVRPRTDRERQCETAQEHAEQEDH